MKRPLPSFLRALALALAGVLTACDSEEEEVQVNATIQNLGTAGTSVYLTLFDGIEPVCLDEALSKSQASPSFEATLIALDTLRVEDYAKGLFLTSGYALNTKSDGSQTPRRAEVTISGNFAKRVSGSVRLFDTTGAQVGTLRAFEARKCPTLVLHTTE